jgi:hypothetical protein
MATSNTMYPRGLLGRENEMQHGIVMNGVFGISRWKNIKERRCVGSVKVFRKYDNKFLIRCVDMRHQIRDFGIM